LPTVLGQEEVNRLIGCVDHLKHRAVLLTLYSAGLRLTEATNLKAQNIDSQRMQIKIVRGKGNRDRFVPLSPRLLHVLLEYWIAAKPTDFLFPGKTPNVPLHGATIQICCKLAAAKAHLNKHVTPHTLPRLERIVLWQAPTDLVAKRREWLTMRNVFTTKECNSRMSASGISLTTEGESNGLGQLRCQAVRTVTNGRTIRQPRAGNLTTGMLQPSHRIG
jgi:site-specific recombinase XerC